MATADLGEAAAARAGQGQLGPSTHWDSLGLPLLAPRSREGFLGLLRETKAIMSTLWGFSVPQSAWEGRAAVG